MRSKYIFLFSVLMSFSLLFSCQSNKEKEESAADYMLSEASALCIDGEYEKAQLLLDSLHKSYPMLVEKRRKADAIGDTIKLITSKRDLIFMDSILIVKKAESVPYSYKFLYSKDDRYETYGKFTLKDLAGFTSANNYFSCYFNENDEFFLVSYYQGVNIAHNSLIFNCTDSHAKFPLSGNDANYHTYTTAGVHFERLTLSGESAIKAAEFLSSYSNVTVSLEGRGKTTYPLTESNRLAIETSLNYFIICRDIRKAEKEIIRLNKRIFTIKAKNR